MASIDIEYEDGNQKTVHLDMRGVSKHECASLLEAMIGFLRSK